MFNADKTYFVLNGTSSSNKVALNALLAPNDLVLFDRNNHKSNHHGALIQAGATPVYLETARNPLVLSVALMHIALKRAIYANKLQRLRLNANSISALFVWPLFN